MSGEELNILFTQPKLPLRNSIKLDQIFDAAITLMTSVSTIAIFLYSEHIHFSFSNKSATMKSLGHAFVGLVAYIKVIETKITNLAQHGWYLTDGFIVETETALNEALDIRNVLGKSCGRDLRRDKCEAWLKGALKIVDRIIKRNNKKGPIILIADLGPVRCDLFTKACSKDQKTTGEPGQKRSQCALGFLSSCLRAIQTIYSHRCNTLSEEAVKFL